MKKLTIGYFLIIAGILLLLNNLFNITSEFLWGAAFLIVGTTLLVDYLRRSHVLSSLILSLIFFFIGTLLTIDSIHSLPNELSTALFFWCLSTVFIAIHLKTEENWWAVLPGGILFIIGVIIILESFQLVNKDLFWFIFLLGLSLIFWYLLLIKNEQNKLGWAKYPALVITVVSFFVLSVTWKSMLTDILFPVSIIFAGIYLVIYSVSKSKKQKIDF